VNTTVGQNYTDMVEGMDSVQCSGCSYSMVPEHLENNVLSICLKSYFLPLHINNSSLK